MCDCIAKTNSILEQSGIKAEVGTITSFLTGKSRMTIELIKKPNAKRLPSFAATYCPICGEKYK